MSQTFTSLHHHVVFSTKNRAATISPKIRDRLFEYVGGILRRRDCLLVAAGGMPDHVHLLVSLSKNVSVSDVVRLIKSNSSKWIHETFPTSRGFQWQSGYGAFAVSYSALGSVERYLAEQARHHRKMTFQEEFIGLLKRHHIDFDPRYIWD
jgi:REP element-mobilizing transposase RayT